MKQTVLARKELNKGAEWLKTNNATSVLLAYLWNLNNSLDALCSSLGSTVSASDKDGAILLDVNGCARILLDTADNLATRANDVANLIGWDRKRDNLWSGLFGLSTRCRNLLKHLVQNEHTALLSLEKCAAQNLWSKTSCLVVHLHCGNTLGGTADLEVHVAEEVLKTLDIGKNNSLAVLLDKTHCNTRNRTL